MSSVEVLRDRSAGTGGVYIVSPYVVIKETGKREMEKSESWEMRRAGNSEMIGTLNGKKERNIIWTVPVRLTQLVDLSFPPRRLSGPCRGTVHKSFFFGYESKLITPSVVHFRRKFLEF